MAPVTNLYIEQGSDYSAPITLEQNVPDGNGGFICQPVDLTGFTANAQMRRSYQSNSAVDFVVDIVDAVNGKIQLSLDNVVTSSLKPTRYVYDVYITSGGGIRDRVLEGTIIVTPGVTR